MSIKMRYTAEDLLRGTLIEEAAWYALEVTNITEKAADTDSSQNVVVELKIVAEGKYKGVPVQRYFNEKAPGFIKDYAAACGVDLNASGGVFEFESTKNMVIEGFIEQRKDNKGNLQNNVSRFRKRVAAEA